MNHQKEMAYGESNGHMTQKVKVMTPIYLGPIIPSMAGDTDLVTMEHLWKMTTLGSNCHMTDDVTWPWKVKVVTAIRLEPNISKKDGDRLSVPMDHE